MAGTTPYVMVHAIAKILDTQSNVVGQMYCTSTPKPWLKTKTFKNGKCYGFDATSIESSDTY
jgi:hypothetical protein